MKGLVAFNSDACACEHTFPTKSCLFGRPDLTGYGLNYLPVRPIGLSQFGYQNAYPSQDLVQKFDPEPLSVIAPGVAAIEHDVIPEE